MLTVFLAGLALVGLGLALLVLIGFALTRWGELDSRKKAKLSVLLGLQILWVGLLVFVLWPYTPMGLAERAEVAEQFMARLSAGNSDAARGMMINTSDAEYYEEIGRDFSNPENWPVAWVLERPNSRDYVFGEAQFPDGATFEVMLNMTWEWPRGRWGITIVEFGNAFAEKRLGYYLVTEFVPFSWFGWGTAIVGVVLIIFSIRLVMLENSFQPRRVTYI